MGRTLEVEVAKQAAERKASTQAQPGEQVGSKSIGGGDLPPPKGDTRDIVGHAVGMGGSTYQRAKQGESLPGGRANPSPVDKFGEGTHKARVTATKTRHPGQNPGGHRR